MNTWYPGNLSSGDGTNYEEFENIEVMIFDRYGRNIANFSGLNTSGWDGTYNDKALPTGDYWYHIILNDTKGRQFTGHFTLYRNLSLIHI